MHDVRNDQLADVLINQSLKLQAGEKILIQGNGLSTAPLIRSLIRAAKSVGGLPIYRMVDTPTHREWLKDTTSDILSSAADPDAYTMKLMDAYVGVTAPENSSELSDIPGDIMNLYQTNYYEPVHMEIRLQETRWVVLRYPTEAFAQSAGMSREAFDDWFFKVCTVDYRRMGRAMMPLKELMERTNRVRIVGPGETDLSFRITDIPVIACSGECNIPDGEIYTAPVKDSVEGVIAYNTPSILDGFEFTNIRFRFEQGKIVEATANDESRINTLLDMDEGARYIGEFAIGLNPFIAKPIKNTLFDEKIRGSIHFTPGSSYDDAFNGNRSALHWDIVLLQEADSGGGEIWFDDVLIRKDGLFILPELEGLNPENLI